MLFPTNKKILTVQDKLGFEEIKNDMIIVNNNEYRVIFECKKVNLRSKDDKERKEVIDLFKETINLLKMPIQWKRDSYVLDIEPYINSIDHIAKNSTHPTRQKYLPFYKNFLEREIVDKKLIASKVYLVVGYRIGAQQNEIDKSIKNTVKSMASGLFPKKNMYAAMTNDEKIDEVGKVFRDLEASVKTSIRKVGSDITRLNDDQLDFLMYHSYRKEMAHVQRWGNFSGNGIPVSVVGGES